MRNAITCEARLTAARIAELKEHLCEGEGLTGPCEASKHYDAPAARRQ